MFCNKPKSVNRNVPGKKNRKRKKKPTHPQSHSIKVRNINQSSLNIVSAMSTWAQNYTAATTWQLKHQIAYWKSKAVALQYENKILHEMIREQYVNHQTTRAPTDSSDSESDEDQGTSEESDHIGYEDEEGDEENVNFEVSEEFIEFLKQNAKYKEDARKEREKFKAKQDAEDMESPTQEETIESSEERIARLKELYGDNWEKIMALETSTLCNFISESDRHQPEYWPNIPFNFV